MTKGRHLPAPSLAAGFAFDLRSRGAPNSAPAPSYRVVGCSIRAMADVSQETLLRLLDLQTEDSAIKRLNERRANLPEARRLAEINATLAELNADLEIAQKQHDEIERAQRRLEGEIEVLEQKAGKEEQRMFSGTVANPKELSALQAEVASLKKRRSSLEDELLEVMVQREQASATLERITQDRDEAAREAEQLTRTVGGHTQDIDAELGEHSERRDEVTKEIPDDLMALYDRLREQKSGVGAAALEEGTCQGCHTKLPAKEYERVRDERGLQRCENCRRILVVT